MIKVSIIIPIYNMGLYLEECLDSVMSQTLKEIEVICINDGSTDHSLEILRNYGLRYPNLVIVDQNNCGVGQSRNNGIARATGEFVAFMDPDDFYPDVDILECLYDKATANHVFICGGSFSHLRNNAFVKSYYGLYKDYSFTSNEKMDYREYQFHYGFTRFIYHLKFLKDNKLFFPTYSQFEDPPFFVQAMIYANQFYAMEKITYCYRTGYKKSKRTLEKTIDYAKGIIDLLNITKEYQLGKLHRVVVETIHDDFSPALYNFIAEGKIELHEFVYQINAAIDLRLLSRDMIAKRHSLLEPQKIPGYIGKNIEKENEFLHTLRKHKSIVIYGAGKVGLTVAEYLKSVDGLGEICFAVTDGTNNPKNIEGIPVREIHELLEQKENCLALIATFSHLHEEIGATLAKLRFRNVWPINYSELQLFITR